MAFPFFRLNIPKSTTWKELRENILKAIEEEQRQKTTVSIPTVGAVGSPTSQEQQEKTTISIPTVGAVGPAGSEPHIEADAGATGPIDPAQYGTTSRG